MMEFPLCFCFRGDDKYYEKMEAISPLAMDIPAWFGSIWRGIISQSNTLKK